MRFTDIFKSSYAPAPAPAAEPTPTVVEEPKDPLGDYKDMWDATKVTNTTPEKIFGNVTQEDIQKAASQANFSGTVPQELWEGIQAGGEDAVKAMQQILNHTSQAVFAQNTVATTQLIENAVTKALAGLDKRLPDMLATNQANKEILDENPIYKHPAAQPIVQAITTQLARTNSGKSSAELTKMAKGYLESFAKEISSAGQPAPKAAVDEVDWIAFANTLTK